MKTLILSAILASNAIVGSNAEAATITNSFDVDAQGWIGNPGEGLVAFVGAGGNPGGHIRVTDVGGTLNNGFGSGVFFGPDFSGDLSTYIDGMLSLDMATFFRGGFEFGSFGTIFVIGGGDVATFDIGNAPASASWSGYSAAFSAANFGKTDAEWLALTSNVSSIAIATDAFDGGDTIGIDNVSLSMSASGGGFGNGGGSVSPIPLPGSGVLFGSALFAMGLYRLQRKRLR